ncbi:MAG: hypothetical protein LBS55_06935 [Prevotellaceae bacterium]|jgi:hypothetical protein|nr:hypothetical protein [Prevotellaceae bacterium]
MFVFSRFYFELENNHLLHYKKLQNALLCCMFAVNFLYPSDMTDISFFNESISPKTEKMTGYTPQVGDRWVSYFYVSNFGDVALHGAIVVEVTNGQVTKVRAKCGHQGIYTYDPACNEPLFAAYMTIRLDIIGY